MRVVATNRKALRDYTVIEKYEAGLCLQGSEVKSLRGGRCNLDGSFCRIENAEIIAYNLHIPEFEKSTAFKHNPRREKKLLLKKKEIKRIWGLVSQRGYTLIPLRVYFNERGWAKVEIALCKGKRKYEKKRKLKERDIERESQREISRYFKK
ncbi:MAG TPA: SsrA-binding protein SmpB [candidate division WOR-3 bacterium]|uniref:SsrA-binding protein n=1 Tax=candidate division WOR-3 bacterium TaxID=2052148 RepID=A0A7C5DH17_UNCW3|nr:SsrA-binding protein SmpB [candidate division WOR-3 bacterium]